MAKREFLQLAHVYNPAKTSPAGWFMSEKMDGCRVWWDGGVTYGMPASQVPWANVEKDGRYVNPPIATGLWSRYGKVIHAPDYFVGALPRVSLDGELYMGRGRFQELISTTKQLKPDNRWNEVQFRVFDSPPLVSLFRDGEINNTNFRKSIALAKCLNFLQTTDSPPEHMVFQDRVAWLKQLMPEDLSGPWDYCVLHHQERLPFKTADAEARIQQKLDEVIDAGGEGLILKSPGNIWLPERTHTMLKHKQVQDAEGTVTGYIWGRETDKGSKLLGLMGALILEQDNGKRLELSGFTDAERGMAFVGDQDYQAHIRDYGSKHPGQVVDLDVAFNPTFPLGSRVTYRFRELTDDGIAKEARYWRKREPGH